MKVFDINWNWAEQNYNTFGPVQLEFEIFADEKEHAKGIKRAKDSSGMDLKIMRSDEQSGTESGWDVRCDGWLKKHDRFGRSAQESSLHILRHQALL